jgi:hypothetical protein
MDRGVTALEQIGDNVRRPPGQAALFRSALGNGPGASKNAITAVK